MDHGGGQLINYNTRLLGRRGVMEVVLVADPQTLDASIASFKELVPGYEFGAGEKYAEFREGDHVAEYGLRSEEHTSELQSLMRNSYDVFCLKQKKTINK